MKSSETVTFDSFTTFIALSRAIAFNPMMVHCHTLENYKYLTYNTAKFKKQIWTFNLRQTDSTNLICLQTDQGECKVSISDFQLLETGLSFDSINWTLSSYRYIKIDAEKIKYQFLCKKIGDRNYLNLEHIILKSTQNHLKSSFNRASILRNKVFWTN